MSVPTAMIGLTPITRIMTGVIRAPPPIPVRPIRKPMIRPMRVKRGSIHPSLALFVTHVIPNAAELTTAGEDRPKEHLGRVRAAGDVGERLRRYVPDESCRRRVRCGARLRPRRRGRLHPELRTGWGADECCRRVPRALPPGTCRGRPRRYIR